MILEWKPEVVKRLTGLQREQCRDEWRRLRQDDRARLDDLGAVLADDVDVVETGPKFLEASRLVSRPNQGSQINQCSRLQILARQTEIQKQVLKRRLGPERGSDIHPKNRG